jgi:hypothetical protein
MQLAASLAQQHGSCACYSSAWQQQQQQQACILVTKYQRISTPVVKHTL